jgi:hypothetical protein
MKKHFFFRTACLWAACLFSVQFAHGQSAFEKGTVVMQPGIGYGLIGTEGDVVIPPISLCLEYGSSEEWSFGGYVGYASSKSLIGAAYGNLGRALDPFKYTYFIFGGRLCYHLNKESERADAYAGVTLGYNAVSVQDNGTSFGSPVSASASDILYGGQLGIRYYLGPAVGLFAEAGYGIGYLTAGLSFKFNGKRRTAASQAENTIWQRWDDEVSRAEAEELEAKTETSLRARILEKKQNIFIIDVGQNAGLQTGMDLKVSPLFNGKPAGKYAMQAKVAQTGQRHAIIKIYDLQLASLLAIGDGLVVRSMPLRVEEY